MATFEPYDQTTVRDVIDSGQALDVSEETICFREKITDDLIVPFHNIITKYIGALKNYIVETTLTDEEFFTYKYQPKLFCYDSYGTPELAYSLLYINDMASVTEFKKQTIKVFHPDILEILNELMSLSEQDLIDNRNALQ